VYADGEGHHHAGCGEGCLEPPHERGCRGAGGGLGVLRTHRAPRQSQHLPCGSGRRALLRGSPDHPCRPSPPWGRAFGQRSHHGGQGDPQKPEGRKLSDLELIGPVSGQPLQPVVQDAIAEDGAKNWDVVDEAVEQAGDREEDDVVKDA